MNNLNICYKNLTQKITFNHLQLFPQINIDLERDYLLYSTIHKEFDHDTWNYYLNLLPKHLHNGVMKYHKWEDRHNTLIGKLLIDIGYHMMYGRKLNFDKFLRNDYGKPFLQDHSDFKFNISHSTNMVVCAFSKQLIGIDIEEVKKIDLEGFSSVFSSIELRKIEQGGGLRFYEFWTTKEAVVKAIGKGLTIPLLDINVFDDYARYDNMNWFKQNIIFENYYCTVVSQVKEKKINVLKVEF